MLVAAGLTLLSACGGSGNGGKAASKSEASAPAAAPEGTATVTMRLIAFRPATIDVTAGTSVTWNQQDAGFHTVTSGVVRPGPSGVTPEPDGRFDSARIPERGTYTFTFESPGTYAYFCSVHPATMRGEVRVT